MLGFGGRRQNQRGGIDAIIWIRNTLYLSTYIPLTAAQSVQPKHYILHSGRENPNPQATGAYLARARACRFGGFLCATVALSNHEISSAIIS